MGFATQALDQLEREPYGTAHGRIPAVRQAHDTAPMIACQASFAVQRTYRVSCTSTGSSLLGWELVTAPWG